AMWVRTSTARCCRPPWATQLASLQILAVSRRWIHVSEPLRSLRDRIENAHHVPGVIAPLNPRLMATTPHRGRKMDRPASNRYAVSIRGRPSLRRRGRWQRPPGATRGPGLRPAPLFRKILFVAGDELRDVGGDDVEFAADLFFPPGLQAANPEVTVNTGDPPLEDFLVRLPGDRHDHFFIRRKAA